MSLIATIAVIIAVNLVITAMVEMQRRGVKLHWSNRPPRMIPEGERRAGAWGGRVGISMFIASVSYIQAHHLEDYELLVLPIFFASAFLTRALILKLTPKPARDPEPRTRVLGEK